jgi:flagellin
MISSQRSELGAYQNRLEHSQANDNVMKENVQAAESRIRDVDMATEAVELSKNSILAQVGEAMMTQANQSSQGILALLQ